MTLDDASIEAIAKRVVELLRAEGSSDAQMLDASGIAKRFGVSRHFVYEHAEELGAVRIGKGSRPRLRFDVARSAQFFQARRRPPEPVKVPRGRSRRAIPRPDLLPVKERS